MSPLFSELGRLKALHVEQSSEHEAVLKRLKAENKSVEEECEKLHRTLKGVCVCVCVCV